MLQVRKNCSILGPITSSLNDLPAPMNISLWWNAGSLLGMTLGLQIATGLFLAMHYSPWTASAFSSITDLTREVGLGTVIRGMHANGASLFFVLLYFHMGRSSYFGSYVKYKTWNLGVVILLLSMATAFVGYVLVWGQMSFWGATVITNLLSAIPYMGPSIVEWVWGGFAVDNATLNRFFVFHFILPFAITGVVVLHLIMLHDTGSTNPLGLKTISHKASFHPFFSWKDTVGFIIFFTSVAGFSLIFPDMFTDPENYMPANSMSTPVHIKPEWYFLWAYAILRSIPNKLGGVIAMFAAILVLFSVPKYWDFRMRSVKNYPISCMLYWLLCVDLVLLTWIGGCPVEDPYINLGLLLTILYFALFVFIPLYAKYQDNMYHLKR